VAERAHPSRRIRGAAALAALIVIVTAASWKINAGSARADTGDAPPLVLDPTVHPVVKGTATGTKSVTITNYLAASKQAAACTKSRIEAEAAKLGISGVRVSMSPLRQSADGFEVSYTYRVSVPAGVTVDPNLAARPDQIDAACRHTYVDTVESGYQLAYRTDGARIADAVDDFAECVGRAGGSLGTGATETADVRQRVASVITSQGELPNWMKVCLESHPVIMDASEGVGGG
jgi:hypothetical protein